MGRRLRPPVSVAGAASSSSLAPASSIGRVSGEPLLRPSSSAASVGPRCSARRCCPRSWLEFADATTALWSKNTGTHPAGATLSTGLKIWRLWIRSRRAWQRHCRAPLHQINGRVRDAGSKTHLLPTRPLDTLRNCPHACQTAAQKCFFRSYTTRTLKLHGPGFNM